MTLQTYTVEIKTDMTEEQHAAMTEAMKQLARELFSVAMLLSGGKSPNIICRTTDSFYNTEELEALVQGD